MNDRPNFARNTKTYRRIRWLAVLGLAGLLAGCQVFQIPVGKRAAFPLPPCSEAQFEAASVFSTTSSASELPDKSVQCATGRRLENVGEQVFDATEADLRKKVEQPFLSRMGVTDVDSPALGVSLAGGGTKASSFGMGILAGIADQGAMSSVDYISSVSGGGYAAYFLYAHAAKRILANKSADVASLYVDCVSNPNSEVVTFTGKAKISVEAKGLCEDKGLARAFSNEPLASNRIQAFVRCKQNVMDPGVCNADSADDSHGSPVSLYVKWLLTVPWGLVNNTLFDTGMHTSTVAQTYRNGIGIAYGAAPGPQLQLPDWKEGSRKRFDIDCVPWNGGEDATNPAVRVDGCKNGGISGPNADPLSFADLRNAMLKASTTGERLPYWIINASGTNQRSLPGWFSGYQRSAAQDAFEMTPVLHGSGRYGFVPTSPALHAMSVLDSVAAGAAFMDANEQVLSKVLRPVAGVLLHFSNLTWGPDIRNFNVADARAATHVSAPFPFNLIDRFQKAGEEDPVSARTLEPTRRQAKIERERSVFIHLADGGSSEDMGLLALERRNVRNIVAGDLSGDARGEFGDLCQARKEMLARPEPASLKEANEHPERYRRYLLVPGLKRLDAVCRGEEPLGYDLRSWPFSFPVLLGCIRTMPAWSVGATDCESLNEGDIRLFIVKPAINLKHFEASVVRPQGNESWMVKDCWVPAPATDKDIADEARLLPCDVMTFLATAYERHNPKYVPSFPQHSTVWMTANSDAWRFAAYRELGRQYGGLATHLARKVSTQGTDGTKLFNTLLEQQRTNGVEPANYKKQPDKQ
jgi:hypothetical protein